VLGVTGHRRLDNLPALTDAVHLAIEKVRQMAPPLRHTPVVLDILSPLAEGADRLVTREVMKTPGAMMEAVLPLAKDAYMQDFAAGRSREEFRELLAQARSTRQLPPQGSRTEAYQQLGRYIVDQCDVLIALWDGQSAEGPGGTADVVEYARRINCPLVWIHADRPGEVTVELNRELNPGQLHDLDEYNAERLSPAGFEKQRQSQRDFLMGKAESAGLSAAKVRPTVEYLLRHFVRSDRLSMRYQHRHHQTQSLVYLLALAAVAIAGFQALFLPDLPIILVSEIVLMLAALGIVWASWRQRWHTKWIDYRFLAERFHAALFIAAANITDVAALQPPRHLSLSYTSKDWIVTAFSSVWYRRPRPPEWGPAALEGLKEFLCEAWIEDQIRYHARTSRRHHRRHQRMSTASYALFGLTICAALLHIVNIGSHVIETSLAFTAIVSPAIAASITAIRTHRDYLRSSMRSAEMVNHLQELRDRMRQARDYNRLAALLRETEETMLHEHEDWRVLTRFHTPEIPA
jgi:hypothetical protein